jgi:dihydroorotase
MTEHADTLILTQPDDWHVHLRDGAALQAVVADTARQFARALVMPNLKPPVTTVAQARAYRAQIMAACAQAAQAEPACAAFEPLMTLYLTDQTSAAEIRAAKASSIVHGVKLYPAGATTHSEAGVSAMAGVYEALEAMQDEDIPLLIHGEVVDPTVDVLIGRRFLLIGC